MLTEEEKIKHAEEIGNIPAEEDKIKRAEKIVKILDERGMFEPGNIPEVPNLGKEITDKYFVPLFIRHGAIPKEKLEVGKTYIGSCRNATEAVWNGKCFIYKKYKFGSTFDESINHFQDDNGYDVFVPVKEKTEEK